MNIIARLFIIVSLSLQMLQSSNLILVNLTLSGGADFRFLFAPIPSENNKDYGYWYWYKRTTLFNIGESYVEQLTYFNQNYDEVLLNGVRFGILKKASWLKSKIDKGRVAFLNNILVEQTRNHALATKTLNGQENNNSNSGWGGRLAYSLKSNIVSLTKYLRGFCYLPKDNNNSSIISAYDTRPFGLYESKILPNGQYSVTEKDILARALKSYYFAKRKEIKVSSPFYKFIQQEKIWREFSSKFSKALMNYPLPEELSELYKNKLLSNLDFAQEIISLYDVITLQDLLKVRVISMEYKGWDSHRNEKVIIEPKFEDIFGEDKALDRFESVIKDRNYIFLIGSEFGRQLASNGSRGTDNGEGNTFLIIGDEVKGGFYGDLFPIEEIQNFQKPNSAIKGKVSFKEIIKIISNKMLEKSINQSKINPF